MHFDNQASLIAICLLLYLQSLIIDPGSVYSVQLSQIQSFQLVQFIQSRLYSDLYSCVIQYPVFLENSYQAVWNRNPLLMRDIIRLSAPTPRTRLIVQQIIVPVRGKGYVPWPCRPRSAMKIWLAVRGRINQIGRQRPYKSEWPSEATCIGDRMPYMQIWFRIPKIWFLISPHFIQFTSSVQFISLSDICMISVSVHAY